MHFLLGRRLQSPQFLVSLEGLRRGQEAWEALYQALEAELGWRDVGSWGWGVMAPHRFVWDLR